MLYHHTKFGYERFSDSENTLQTNISWCITIPNLVANGFTVQKISSRQTTEMLNAACDHRNPIFSLDTLAYEDLASKFHCKRIITSEHSLQENHYFRAYSINSHILIA